MSAALNWARKELEWEVPNPFQVRRLKEPAGRNRWLSQTEASKLIQAAENARRSPHLADFIRLGLNTGMRPGELLKLSWSRVDLEMGLIYLEANDQKNGKLGSVPLNREARAVIETRNRWREKYCPQTDWVFCDRKGRRIASAKKGFRSAVERAGLADVHPHDLRRTRGSWLVQKEVDIRTVSELLRNSDVRITAEVYAHLSPANLKSAVDVLDS
ncbi:MAG: site-specific integrase [Gammaproteobacteria bacterium]